MSGGAGERRRVPAPQAVEDERELAAPELGRDVAGELDHAVAPPEEQRDVLRREVAAELTVLLCPRHELRDERTQPASHLLRARAAVLVRLDDVLEAAVAAVQHKRLLDEAREAAPRVVLGERGLRERDQLVERLLEDGVDEIGALREVAVERPDADARVTRDLARRDVDAVRGEQLARGRDETLAIALRVTPC